MIVNGVADLTNRARTTMAVSLAIIAALSLVQLSGISLQFAFANSTVTQPTFRITPSTQTIVEGSYAKFNIDINQAGVANVLLVARDVPPSSNAIFAPQTGVANPQFHSTVTIVTSTGTPAGNYNVTIVALLNGEEYPAYINLQLTPNTTTNQTTTTTSAGFLSLSVDTDQHFYEPNATVKVRGHISDASGDAIGGAGVSIQVDDPTGAQLILVNNLTDDAGIYQCEVWIGPGATPGTYSVFVSSSKSGYDGATTHTTFVVGSSLTPSVVISQVYFTDTSGNPSGVFSVGQTILVWVILQNNGAPFQGVIWLQILDPNGTPRSVQTQISGLDTGTSVKVTFEFTASANLPRGIYAANALVSDKLISQGGTFLTSAKAQFALAGG